ncbi:MAG: glycosyltransferase [Pyrinomonadaceae bacterium]
MLQFIPSFHQGGSERQAVQLTKLLAENGEHTVFTATLNREGVLLKELEDAGITEIPEFRLSSFFDLNFLRQVQKCSRFLKEKKIDVVQTHDFYTNVFGILSAKRAGVALKIASKRETEGIRTQLQKKVETYIFKIADRIVANSGSVKSYLEKGGVSSEKIFVLYNGIDAERLSPAETDRGTICKLLNLPGDPQIKFVTHLANLRHDVKNQEMLLLAAQTLKGKFSNVHYIFAGEGERKESLRKLAADLGIAEFTHFIGSCDVVPELLSVSYLCTLTSTAEGFSNSILEYMFAGKPVIATNVGGASEAVEEGKTGFLVDSNDVDALADRIGELLADEKKAAEFGANGKKRVNEVFSTTRQVRETLSLYGAD